MGCLQERRLREEGGEQKAPEVYFAPTSSDAMISGFRVWLKRFAGGAVKYPPHVDPALPPPPSKEQLFDRCVASYGLDMFSRVDMGTVGCPTIWAPHRPRAAPSALQGAAV